MSEIDSQILGSVATLIVPLKWGQCVNDFQLLIYYFVRHLFTWYSSFVAHREICGFKFDIGLDGSHRLLFYIFKLIVSSIHGFSLTKYFSIVILGMRLWWVGDCGKVSKVVMLKSGTQQCCIAVEIRAVVPKWVSHRRRCTTLSVFK